MPKLEGTILEYTKSAEELRLFELSEKCHEIAHEYELYNIQNGIYEAFGEWFLEEAKNGYSTTFTSYALSKIIFDKNIEPPKHQIIKTKEGDYEKCQALRDICVNGTRSLGGYKSNYAWYTLWKIAKAYNGKHGCIVTEPPSHNDYRYGDLISFSIDWSQDSVDCITGEKWRSDAEKEELGIIASGFFGCLIWIFIWVVWAMAIAITKDRFIGIKTCLIPLVPFFILFSTAIRNFSIKSSTKKLSVDFVKHCQNIEQTKYSKFDVKNGKILRY